ncbi:MAG: hypothetical protein CO118_06305 [Flavobacteriales bacterium CG_4_9_14_3_um_filter_32_8]|nr:MAG: hypothetical protein CO118_06305 [Flavobacteriales bacterium CG_4_9_14_3_um_filter_32_8]
MRTLLLSFFVANFFVVFSQKNTAPSNPYQQEFAFAYQQYPDVPKGILEAVSYTMTRFQHLQNEEESCTGLPKTYGVMGLTLDGKNYFRNNLTYVSQVSGISANDILQSPQQNILAYAAAYHHELTLLSPSKSQSQNYARILTQLSELPDNGLQQDFALNSHLYSVLSFLNDVKMQQAYNFPKYQLDLEKVFGEENLKVLQSSKVVISNTSIEGDNGQIYKITTPNNKSVDYPPAVQDLTPCNYSSRSGTLVSAITIHTIQGSYAGAISWFKNCSAQVSAHYVLRSSDGQVTQMVLESNKAWHVGSENPYTIGFEHEGWVNDPSWYTVAMYQSSADIVRDITNSGYGISPLRTAYFPWTATTNYNTSSIPGSCVKVKGHQHYPNQTHTDPGANWNWKYFDNLINNTTPITTITANSGTITDNGGSSGNYTGERQLYLIQPASASIITLTKVQFDVESTWDYLYIYDGNSVAAPLIGYYTGTTIPATITSSGGSILLELRSDCSTYAPGFIFNYTSSSPDVIAPTTSVTAPSGWVTGNFTTNFTDADNAGGSGLEKSYYQVIDYDGTEWRANANNGFFSDNFDAAIHSDWTSVVGSWSINTNSLFQSDEVEGNTNIAAALNQSLSNRYLYHFEAKIDGSGTNRRAGFHFFADSDTLTNRGNSYFVWFRVDNAKLQIYKVVNDVFGPPVLDMPLTTVAGQLYDYKVIYDRITGKITVYRNNTFITSWVDSSPIATGNFISFRSGNATLSVNQLKVFRSRNPSVIVSVGSAATNDIRYQNPNPATPAGKVKSIVNDAANNISSIAEQLINVDWTPPTAFTVEDGVAADIDTTLINTQLDANWNASSDSHSALVGYWYAIGTTPGDSNVVSWTNNLTATNFSQTSLSLIYNQDYYVSVRAENGAGLFTNIIADGIWVMMTTSVSEPTTFTCSIYPNPFHQNITIDIENKGEVELTLFDVSGKIIFTKTSYQQKNITLDMKPFNLGAGNYFLKIKKENTIETIRLIKN